MAVGQPDRVADPRELLDLAVTAARGAADLLRSSRPDPEAIATKSSRTDLVTDLDRAAEARIIDLLIDARPDDGVLGEEGGRRTGSSGVRWVIDPLDGTTNYVYGYPVYGVSIAAEADGVLVAGARVGRLGTTEPLTLLAAPPELYDALESLLDAAGAGF